MVACTPHPGWGTVTIERRVVDLATCRTSAARKRFVVPTLTVTASRKGTRGTQTIRYRGRPVYTVHERYDRMPAGSPGPIMLEGMSPDHKWVFFAIDPQGSESLAADGLTLRVVSVTGGRAHAVASGLLANDYRTWCGNRLVMTAGGDRLAGHNKYLISADPPGWRAHVVLRDRRRAFGSLTCAPDGESVIVQSARATGVNDNAMPMWSLWRYFWYDHSLRRLTTPPPGFSDDSPRISEDERRIVFVRSHRGNGVLYALGAGPLLGVGHDDGYYGHRPWDFLSWSLERR